MNTKSLFITSVAILILFPGTSAAAGKTIYVDDSATGENNGSSWLNAYKYLQDALAAATTGDQVLVAQGIYKPDKGQGITPGDRSASFHLTNGLTLKGSYAGFSTPNPDARDIDTYSTILSGDLAGNDIEVTDPAELMSEQTREENGYNVVDATGCDRTTLLEGFTITAGNAISVTLGGGGIINGKPTVSQCRIIANTASTGGGIYFDHSAHTPGALLKDSIVSHNSANYGGGIYNCAEIINCVISGNSAIDGYAGGIYLGSDCETSITDCIISNNSAAENAGGVFVSFSDSEVIFTRCTFLNNSAWYKGGAIYADGCTCGSYSTFYQCKFIGNSAAGNGGAICDYGFTDMQLYSCLLVGNSSGENGGALCDEYDGGSALINCTVSNNTAAGQGGAVCYDNYSYKGRRLANTIIWANSDKNGHTHQYSQIYLIEVSELQTVTNCCIQVIPPEIKGQGNITSNPFFADIDGADNIPGNEDDNLHLLGGSGCIDTGHNEYVPPQSSDLDGKPRIVNATVDRGAYEHARDLPHIIYVDDTATGMNNGTSWKDAFKYLQVGILTATSGDEIHVAWGTYKPNEGIIGDVPDERALTCQLKNGVTIKGGYAGFGQPDPDNRNIEVYQTILSGDLRGNDVDVSDPCLLPREPSRLDNSYHVVTGSGTNTSAILDGVTITAGHGEYGGGMFNVGGSPTIKNCTFLQNSAFAIEYSGGGGLYIEDGSPTFINCRFIHNASDASIRDHGGGDGGAIDQCDSNSIFIDCTFISNVAAGNHGGAISHCGGSPELKGCTFRGNFAQKCGGGLCNWWGHPKLTDCTFIANAAGSDAGGMYNCGNSSLIKCEFVGNKCRQNGGGFSSDGLNPTIDNCTFTENSAEKAGGAIANRTSSPTITRCTFTANTAGFGGGGGIYNRENANPIVSDCTFSRNLALLDYGGGGICNNASSPVVSNCTFTQNKADDNGGAVSNWYGSSPTLTDCLFMENTAWTCGGLHSHQNCNPTVINCKFIRNSSGSFGGAMSIGVNCIATVINCLFAQNSAGTHAGGLYSYSSYPTLLNCTFAANSAPNGSALAFASATNLPVNDAKLANCILWDGGNEIWKGDDSTIAITHSDVHGGWPGQGNLNTNPLFMNQAGGNYHLGPNSPCINAGNNSAIPPEVTTDLDGRPRIINGTVDMGAYEYEPRPSRIIYVDDSATGANNGSSWADAFNYLQDSLADANASETPTEIRVAAGTYRPDKGGGQTLGDRNATFQLLNSVTIKGGYAGTCAPDPDAHDIQIYQTILSGDLTANDVNVNNPEKLGWEPTRSENSYRVVTGSQTDETAIIDGFTITGGYANYYDFSQCNGAGMFNDHGSPTVLNCTFIANFAGNDDGGGLGSGMYNFYSHPTINNCRFIRNAAIALDGGEGAGGAILNDYSNPKLTNCTFIGNVSGHDGGGMWSGESNPVLVNCIFSGNLAREGGSGSYGGGMWSYGGSASLVNCTFAGNTARSSQIGQAGGGIYAEYLTDLTLTNCILWGNISNGVPEEVTQICIRNGTVDINYSCIQGWTGDLGGIGNIGDDPLFVTNGNCHLQLDSPCIDSGNNAAIPTSITTDLDGRPRIIGGTVDMGTHEFYMLCVDDDAPADPGPHNPQISDPLEIGSEAHPFDSIQKAIDRAKNGYAVVAQPGYYLSSDQWTYGDIRLNGKNITLTSSNPADPEIVDTTILGGTILFSGTEDPNCTLAGFKIQNSYFGAVYGEHTHATLERCVISGNGPCGATVLKDWDGIVSNCLITDNITLLLCGVYPIVSECNGQFKNCTIANNISGISVGNATIENCIIYYNAGAQISASKGKTLHIRYSDIQGGLKGIVGGGNVDWGIGNFDIDPCFVRLGYWLQKNPPRMLIEGDYHLKSQGWRWNKDSKSWTYDNVTSRCIDAANPGLPLGDEPLAVPRDPENIWGENLRINIGAHGGTKQASLAPTTFALGSPEIGPWAFLADLNNDGTVDVADLAGQVQNWLNNGTVQPGDLNRDNVVNMVDFTLLAENWLSLTAWFE